MGGACLQTNSKCKCSKEDCKEFCEDCCQIIFCNCNTDEKDFTIIYLQPLKKETKQKISKRKQEKETSKDYIKNLNIEDENEKFNSFIPSKISEDYLIDLELNNPERQQERMQCIEQISNEFFEEKTEEEFTEKLMELGETIQESIYYNLHHTPENFVKLDEIKNDSSPDLFIPGILSSYLEQNGINNIIQKNSNNEKISNIILQSIFNGDAFNQVIHLHLSYGEANDQIILNDEEKQKEFILDKQKNYARILNKNINDIIISKPREGGTNFNLIVKNSLPEELKEFIKIIKQYEESKHTKIIDINLECLLSFCAISPDMFDHNYDRLNDEWGINEKRGPPGYLIDYDPPLGYKGYGLKVSKKYDNEDDTWLGYENKIGEWYIAYHGTCGSVAKAILDVGFKRGEGQVHEFDNNINPLSKDKFEKVNKGVYCSPKISVADFFATGGEITFNNKTFRFVFMLRVNPYKIRICENKPDYWVFKGDHLNEKTNIKYDDEARPYRILIKEIGLEKYGNIEFCN